MKKTSNLLGLSGNSPLFKIIDFLNTTKGTGITKKEIIQETNISRAALYNYMKELENYDIIKITRIFGKTRLYALNTENPITKKILELESVLIVKALLNSAKKRTNEKNKKGIKARQQRKRKDDK